MSLWPAYERLLAELRRDPHLPAPRLRDATPAGMREWKDAVRAFDAAQIALKIATRAQVQNRNSAVKVGHGVRIIRHEHYA